MKRLPLLSFIGLMILCMIGTGLVFADDSPGNISENEADFQQMNNLSQRIQRLKSDFQDVLADKSVTVIPILNREELLSFSGGLEFNWVNENTIIEVPTYGSRPVEIRQVKEELIAVAKKNGSKLLRSVQLELKDRWEESLYFGFVWQGHQIITDQYLLIKLKPQARLAFIIDDLGYHWSEFERMMTIPLPLTFAVLPYLPESHKQAERVIVEGYDLILHQPMEPVSNANPGEGAIYTSMTDAQILQTIRKNLASLPTGIIGANNHMGSKATADQRVMGVVLKYFKEQDLFFVDSSTSPQSVVRQVSRTLGVLSQENKLFIDNVDEMEAIKGRILQAGRIALRDGQALAIGHVRNYTAKAILATMDELRKMGVQVVFVKDLLY